MTKAELHKMKQLITDYETQIIKLKEEKQELIDKIKKRIKQHKKSRGGVTFGNEFNHKIKEDEYLLSLLLGEE